MKRLLFVLFVVITIASCNRPTKDTSVTVINTVTDVSKIDTVFLDKNLLKNNYWIEFAFGSSEIPEKPMVLRFLNDTVVKYYFGGDGCWNENYKSWEKYYDCYKIYNDTIEIIQKLVNKPGDDNKYELSPFDWPKKYKKTKFYINPYKNDTIFEMEDDSFTRWFHTLSAFKVRYKIKHRLLFEKK